MSLIAEIAVSGTHYSFDMLFSYAVPQNMSGTIQCGCRVLVPFGKGNTRKIGVVMRLTDGDDSGLKTVSSLADSEPVLSEELIRLAFYLHDNTFCTYFEAVKVMLPPAMNVIVKEKFRVNSNFTDFNSLGSEATELFCKLQKFSDDKQSGDFINDFISGNGRRIIDELCENGAVTSNNIFCQKVGDAVLKMVRLTDEYISCRENFSLTPKQKKVADFLEENGTVSSRETAYMCGVTLVVIANLVRNGVAEEYEMETFRHVEDFSEECADINETVLSDEQQNAYNIVSEQVHKRQPAVFLLHGVTGSGKTSVFEKLISDTVSGGRQVMMLIPEISLTPQILKRFRSLFGERVAVIHSGLTLGQRLDEYKRIRNGDADIVIGTRSAVLHRLTISVLLSWTRRVNIRTSRTNLRDTMPMMLQNRGVLITVQRFCLLPPLRL